MEISRLENTQRPFHKRDRVKFYDIAVVLLNSALVTAFLKFSKAAKKANGEDASGGKNRLIGNENVFHY